MPSVRLRTDQVERLKLSGNGNAVIREAINRYNQGEFVTFHKKKHKNKKEILQIYSLTFNPGITSANIRYALDCHWNKPNAEFVESLKKQIAELDRQIKEMFSVYQSQTFIQNKE